MSELVAPAPVTRGNERRVLASLYLLFAIAASCRAVFQLTTEASRAPLAFSLSAVAGAIYVAGAIVIRRTGPATRRWTIRLAAVELTGVLVVGFWSLIDPGAFPQPSVWSDFGIGYAFVPAVLPVAALRWAHRHPFGD